MRQVAIPVYVLTLKDYNGGNNEVMLFRSDEELDLFLVSYVSNNWSNLFDDDDPMEDWDDPIDHYFSHTDDEGYDRDCIYLRYRVDALQELINAELMKGVVDG